MKALRDYHDPIAVALLMSALDHGGKPDGLVPTKF
jgi:hypothetical protein